MQSRSIRTGKRTGYRNIWANTFCSTSGLSDAVPASLSLPELKAASESYRDRLTVISITSDPKDLWPNGLRGARHHMGQPQRLGRSDRQRPVRGQRHPASGNHLSRRHRPRLVGRIRTRAPRATAENIPIRLKRERSGSCCRTTSRPDYETHGNRDIFRTPVRPRMPLSAPTDGGFGQRTGRIADVS